MGNGRLTSGVGKMTKANLVSLLLTSMSSVSTSTSSVTGVGDHELSEGADLERFAYLGSFATLNSVAKLEELYACEGEGENGEVGNSGSHV